MTKVDLRKEFLAKRNQLSLPEASQRSQLIADNFFSYFRYEGLADKAGAVHTFLPIQRHNEMNTWLIIKRFWAEYKTITISVPVLQPASRALLSYNLFSDTQLVENKLGIPEPAIDNRQATPLHQLIAVLVPLLAFDRQGHRVGYGGGYYDRFLASCVPNAQKIGLSLFEPVATIEQVESTDIQLDACITPTATYRFG